MNCSEDGGKHVRQSCGDVGREPLGLREWTGPAQRQSADRTPRHRRRRDHFAAGRVLKRHDFGRARQWHGRQRERGLVEYAVRLRLRRRVTREDRADVQVGSLQDLDLGAQDELAQVRGHPAKHVRGQERVDRVVGLAEARERNDASLAGAAGRHLGPAVCQQPHVVRELALQEGHGIGAANAQDAESRQQQGAKSLCEIVGH